MRKSIKGYDPTIRPVFGINLEKSISNAVRTVIAMIDARREEGKDPKIIAIESEALWCILQDKWNGTRSKLQAIWNRVATEDRRRIA